MTLFVGSFALFMMIGIPIVIVLGLASLTYLVVSGQTHLLIALPQRLIVGIDQFVLLTVPLFILAGNIMAASGISDRIIRFAQTAVGHLRGGLSLVNVSSSVFFAGVSGSATADVAAMGSVLIPGMKREGYPLPYAAALTAASSIIGPIIPPSIALVVFGALSSTSIGDLFLAGIVPGILLGLGFALYALWTAKRRGYPRRPRAGLAAFARGFVNSLPILLLPVIIIGGIRWGIVTATEAAVIAVLYALAISAFIYRSLSFNRLFDAIVDSAVMTSAIMLIIAMASIVAFVFGIERIPSQIVAAVSAMTDSKVLVLLLINVVLLLLGCFLEPIGAMIIVLPVLLELAQHYAIDPVHLGVIVSLNLVIGMITPPVGLCLFIACSVGKVSLEQISRAILPLLGVAIAVLLLITYVPDIVLLLPALFAR